MKRNSIVKLLVLLLLVAGCRENVRRQQQHHMAGTDSGRLVAVPGGLNNAPVNKEIVGDLPVLRPDSGMRILTATLQGRVVYDTRNEVGIAARTGGRIEKMYIRYNYQPVQKGQLLLELYTPELVAAQRELLLLYHRSEDIAMQQRARQRLLLLGMQESQIVQVLKTGNPFYRLPVYSRASGYIVEKTRQGDVSGNGVVATAADATGTMGGMGSGTSGSVTATASPAAETASPLLLREGQYINAGQTLFTIYTNNDLVAEFFFPPALAAGMPVKGQRLVFHRTGDATSTLTAAIGLIQPVVQSGQSFTQARVYLGETALRPGQLLTAYLPLVFHSGWWVPSATVWQTGNQAVVFRRQGNVFVPEKVAVGVALNGMVQVTDNIGGWELAAQASYLVDSESFIQ